MTTTTVPNAAETFTAYQAMAAEAGGYLGRLVILTVHGGLVDRAAINDALARQNITHRIKASAETDVFRKVTSAINNTTVTLDDGARARLLMVSITNNGDVLTRRLVVEILNSKDERLSYTEMHDITFDRDTTAVTVTPLATSWTAPPAAREVAVDATSSIATEFRYQKQMVDANGLRAAIIKILRRAHAVTVKESGGVYFVPESNAATVESLVAVAAEFATVRFHDVPLLDDPRQRGLVRDAVEDEIVAACDALLAEAAKESEAGGLSARRRASILARQDEMRKKLEEYRQRLGSDMQHADTRLQFVTMQMQSFLNA